MQLRTVSGHRLFMNCRSHRVRSRCVCDCQRSCYVCDSGCAQCFPSSASVSVRLPDGVVAARAMEQLRVGDCKGLTAGAADPEDVDDDSAKASAAHPALVRAGCGPSRRSPLSRPNTWSPLRLKHLRF